MSATLSLLLPSDPFLRLRRVGRLALMIAVVGSYLCGYRVFLWLALIVYYMIGELGVPLKRTN